jgi:hypothetical protein
LLSNPSTPQSVNAVFISGTTAKPAIVVQVCKTYYINSNGEQYPRVAIDGKGQWFWLSGTIRMATRRWAI